MPTGQRWLSIPWLFALGVFLVLLHQRLPFDGVRELRFALDGQSPWFDPWLPRQRVSAVGRQSEGWVGQKIFQEPVYASLRLPGAYTQARIGLVFRSQQQPLIDVGLRQDASGFFYLQPLWSETLNNPTWREVTWRGKHGYVREGVPDSVLTQESFDRLLTWHATSTAPAWMDSQPKLRTWRTSLRGLHEISLVPVDGTIEFSLVLQDMNRKRERGAVVLSLSQGGSLLWSEAISLAGSRDVKPSALYKKTVRFTEQAGGVYKLTINADDDVFIREITSPLRRWVIGPRVYVGDQVGYARGVMPARFWTNSRSFSLQTFHREGLQTVRFGTQRVAVTSTHQAYTIAASNVTAPAPGSREPHFEAPRGDMRILGDGFVALAPELLFLPAPRRFTDISQPHQEDIVAVVTPYKRPVAAGDGWYAAALDFPVDTKSDSLKLTLGAPGIGSRHGEIHIKDVFLRYATPGYGWRQWGKSAAKQLVLLWRAL